MGKFATKRRKKRLFTGNRFTKGPRVDNQEGGDVRMSQNDAGNNISLVEGETSNANMASGNLTSFRKLQPLVNERTDDKALNKGAEDITGFRCCDMELIAGVFCLLKCSECDSVGLSFEEDDANGKLTNAMIDKLQNYYGIAVRSNVGVLGKMTKAIHASLFHCASSKANPYHIFHCPPGSDSWCRYQQDKANGTKSYKHGPGLPKDVIQLVKPVYHRLTDRSLLEKCLHGQTKSERGSEHTNLAKNS